MNLTKKKEYIQPPPKPFAEGVNKEVTEKTITVDLKDADKHKPFDLAQPETKVSWFRFWKKRKQNKVIEQEHDSVIVIFETTNGKFKMWLQVEIEEGFKYKGKKYIFDVTQRIHFPELNKFGYFFQESLDIPVNKRIRLNPKIYELITKIQKDIDGYFKKPIDKHIDPVKVREAIDESGLTEIENAIEPKSLMRFIDTQVILQVMGGAWFTKVMKIVLILCLVLIVFNLILIGGTAYIGWETYQMAKVE